MGLIGGAAPALTYTGGNAQSNNISGSYTTPSLAFGPTDPTRNILACVGHAAGTGGTAAVSIGGVPATLLKSATTNDHFKCEIWGAYVPTGTNGSIVVSGITGTWNADVVLYSLTGAESMTPTDSDSSGSTTSPTISLSLDVIGNGVVLAHTYSNNNPSNAGTWTGITSNFSNRYTLGGGAIAQNTASYAASSATPLNASITIGGSPLPAGVAVSFR